MCIGRRFWLQRWQWRAGGVDSVWLECSQPVGVWRRGGSGGLCATGLPLCFQCFNAQRDFKVEIMQLRSWEVHGLLCLGRFGMIMIVHVIIMVVF